MHNVMLEKLAGNDNIEKIQIIMLFEADFNHNNKWLGWVTMAAEKTECCGTRTILKPEI